MKYFNKKGFTLVEILLSIAVMTAIAAFSFPIYQSFQSRNELEIASNTVAQSLRRAQVLSQVMEGDSSWGVKIQSGSVVVFKGASYATRDAAYDESFDFSTQIAGTGVGEVVFSKLEGVPGTTGTITLSSAVNNESRALVINAKGTASY